MLLWYEITYFLENGPSIKTEYSFDNIVIIFTIKSSLNYKHGMENEKITVILEWIQDI